MIPHSAPLSPWQHVRHCTDGPADTPGRVAARAPTSANEAPFPDLVLVSGIAAAYWATGRLALLLAIPPGYATAIWPPAGIAFAAILVCGARVWPGIVLGSFLVNVWTAFDTTTVVSLLTSIALPTSIGMGIALQALEH